MVGAVERMIKLGRNFGIGTALVSQRPQAVNKDVLNQSEAMFCFQMTGPQERKTIEGWVQEKGAGGRDIGDQLPSLPIGTALMWSPQWLGLFGKYKILRKATYDASATPDGAAKPKAAALAPIDLDQVKAAMAATLEEAKAKDPTELRREVARLRAELAKRPAAAAAAKTVVRDVIPASVASANAAALTAVEGALRNLSEAAQALKTQAREISRAPSRSRDMAAITANVVPSLRPASIWYHASTTQPPPRSARSPGSARS